MLRKSSEWSEKAVGGANFGGCLGAAQVDSNGGTAPVHPSTTTVPVYLITQSTNGKMNLAGRNIEKGLHLIGSFRNFFRLYSYPKMHSITSADCNRVLVVLPRGAYLF